MIKIFLLAKKIHRLLVLAMIVMTSLMAGTGILLKYISSVAEKFPSIDLNQVRYIHNNLSVAFTIVLVLMAITGGLMYFIPYLQSRKTASTVHVETPSTTSTPTNT